MVSAEDIYFTYSPTNQRLQGLTKSTILGYFLNWITLTTFVIA